MKNKPNTIETFEELTEKILVRGDLLSTYLRGHLMTEFICKKILRVKPNKYLKHIEKMGYYELTKALYELQYINDEEKKVLLEINKIRNSFAHDLTFFPTVVDLRILFQNAHNTFLEFFDGFSRSLKKLDEIEQISSSEIEILIDFFMEILYNLKCNFDQIFEEYNLI